MCFYSVAGLCRTFSCGWVEFVILYSGEKVIVSRRHVDFSVDLGGEGEWPDVGSMTACITVNRSGDVKRLTTCWRA